MLSSIILSAVLSASSPDLAFDIRYDDPATYKKELNVMYPGFENFWSTDAYGLYYMGAGTVIAPGDGDGDKIDYAV